MSIDPVTMEELLATETAQGSLRPPRVGETVEGTVDVGVADGLVHRSEITWEKGVDPTSLHRLGHGVQVVVGVDRDRQRISLSIKRLGADPWERYVNQLETGQTVDATVTRDAVVAIDRERRRLSLSARLAERT